MASDSGLTPHIERKGLGYRVLNAQGEILPREPKLVYFEEDPVTPAPAGATLSERVNFRFDRYPEIHAEWRTNVSAI